MKLLPGNKLEIDLVDVFEDLDKPIQLIEALSCMDKVIEFVADQIVKGYTHDNGYNGARMVCAVVGDDRGTPLDRAIRRISLASGEIARREIRRLEQEVQHQTARGDEYLAKYQSAINENECLRQQFLP